MYEKHLVHSSWYVVSKYLKVVTDSQEAWLISNTAKLRICVSHIAREWTLLYLHLREGLGSSACGIFGLSEWNIG